MTLPSFFLPDSLDDAPLSPLHEVEGPLKVGDPVHENMTLLTLRLAIEILEARASFYPRGTLLKEIDLMTLPDWDSKKQHKFDPKDAPESTQEFLRGVYWPDDPRCYFFKTIRGIKKYTTGGAWLSEFKDGKRGRNRTPAELIARSHFGDLQFFHAMACKLGEPADETRNKILFWAHLQVELALGVIDPKTLIRNIPDRDGLSLKRLFSAHWNWTLQQLLAGTQTGAEELSPEDIRRRATGVLLHLIQDSYAAGHVTRSETEEVEQFHDYSHQDSHRHGRKDKMGPGKNLQEHLENTPGALEAISQGASVVALLDAAADPDEIMEHLSEEVFPLAEGVQPAGPGEEFKAKHPARRPGLGRWHVLPAPTDFPGSWRGGPKSKIGQAIAIMIDKMRKSEAAGITIMGDTVESLFTRAILNNKRVSNEMILQMSKVTLGPPEPKDKKALKAFKKKVKENLWLVPNSEESIKLAERLIPNARDTDVHRFTVSLMYACTGVNKSVDQRTGEPIDEKKLSYIFPDLGMSGHQSIRFPVIGRLLLPKWRFFWLSEKLRVQRSTALHDFTDYLHSAGIKGINRAVWHFDGRMISALNSILPGFDRY